MFKARPSLLKTPLPFLKDLHRAFLPPFTSHHLTEDTGIYTERCAHKHTGTHRDTDTHRDMTSTHIHTQVYTNTLIEAHIPIHTDRHIDTQVHIHTDIHTTFGGKKIIYCLTINIIRSRVRPSETQP